MIITHIPYETAKRIKAFLGDGAVEPMGHDKYQDEYENRDTGRREMYPMYELCDLLSRPFCEAMAKKHPHARYFDGKCEDFPWEICLCLNEANFNGGLPAVCKALEEMMEGK